MKFIERFYKPHKPCTECPFTRNAMRGWFGPYSGQHYLNAALGETSVQCHMSSKDTPENHRHCTGIALFRDNICKVPRRENQSEHQRICVKKYDAKQIHKSTSEFLEYHHLKKEET